jgi:hypothetical protein
MQERDRRFGSSRMPAINRTASPSRTASSISQSPTKKVEFSSFIFQILYNQNLFRHYRHHGMQIMNQH